MDVRTYYGRMDIWTYRHNYGLMDMRTTAHCVSVSAHVVRFELKLETDFHTHR